MPRNDREQVATEEIPVTAPPESPNANGSPAALPTGLGAPGGIRTTPMPAGAVIFGELTSAFVDGPKLLRFLGERGHTGALVASGGGRTQVAVLHEGQVIAMVSCADNDSRRIERLELPGPGGDEHQLTVMTYRPDVALSLGQLVNLPERFERLHGSFVDLAALLAWLRKEKANGAVRISTGKDTAVVLLRGGEVLGAYTAQRPELEDSTVATPLAKAADAEIDVHIGALTLPPPSVSVGSVV